MKKIKDIKNNETINYILRKIKEIMIKIFFAVYYNWKIIAIIIFAITILFININMSNTINNISNHDFIKGFINYLNDILGLITFNKIKINSIYLILYVLEITLLCGVAYLLNKYFSLKNKHQEEFKKIKGFANAEKEYPYLIKQKRNRTNYKVLEEIYNTNGVPLKEWKDKTEDIETSLDRVLVDIKEVNGSKNKICLYSTSPKYKVPQVINWNDNFISSKNSVLVLGENMIEKIIVDLNKTPHFLARWKYWKWKICFNR